MSSFKAYLRFLKEMPVFTEPVKCPKGHEVEPFDMALEDVTIVGRKERDEIAKSFFFKQGEVPVYCTKENIFFIYDFKTNNSRLPKSRHDKEKVGILLNGMFRHSSPNGRGSDAKLHAKLKDFKQWKVPSEVWDLKHL